MSGPWDDATLNALLSFNKRLLFFAELTQNVLQQTENGIKIDHRRMLCVVNLHYL